MVHYIIHNILYSYASVIKCYHHNYNLYHNDHNVGM